MVWSAVSARRISRRASYYLSRSISTATQPELPPMPQLAGRPAMFLDGAAGPARAPSAPARPVPARMRELARATAMPVDTAKALHPAFYVDDEYAVAECTRIFGMNWFAVANTAELANPGDLKVVNVGEYSFILTCESSGGISATWAYRRDADLESQGQQGNLNFSPVPGVETFAGLVFLNPNPNLVPFSDVVGDLPAKLKRYELDQMEVFESRSCDIRGNWKLLAENFIDFYQAGAVYPRTSESSQVDDHQPYQGQGQYVGFVASPLSDVGSPADLHHFNCFPGLREKEQKAALFFHIFPNVSVAVYPHSVYSMILLPSSESGKTHKQLTFSMAPGAKKEANDTDQHRRKCRELMDLIVNVVDEDIVAIEHLQRRLQNMRSSKAQGEFIPHYDWPIHRFQNMLLNGLQGHFVDHSVLPQLFSTFEQELLAQGPA